MLFSISGKVFSFNLKPLLHIFSSSPHLFFKVDKFEMGPIWSLFFANNMPRI